MNNVNQSVSGGIGGFVTFFVLALALWLLVRNMNTRLRNVAYREEAERKAEALAQASGSTGSATGTATSPRTAGTPPVVAPGTPPTDQTRQDGAP